MTFDNLCVLLNGAPDRCAEHLERRLRSRWSFHEAWALAAIGTGAALTAIAGLVRDGADPGKEFEDSGIWTPAPGPAQYRFTRTGRPSESGPCPTRQSCSPRIIPSECRWSRSFADRTPPRRYGITCRCASTRCPACRLAADRVHLTSPTGSVGWTLTAAVGPDGLWYDETVTFDEPPSNDDLRIAAMRFGHDAGSVRRLRYVGPPHKAAEAIGCPGGRIIHGYADLASWCEQPASDAGEPFTYVVDLAGSLRLAPRRSEHVACAWGTDVLAAGEMGFTLVGGAWQVSLVSNLSTGYCPDLDSWNAVAAALAGAGIAHPDGFTDAVVFRLCPDCGERNLVKEQVYACAICDGPLPADWNFDTVTAHDR